MRKILGSREGMPRRNGPCYSCLQTEVQRDQPAQALAAVPRYLCNFASLTPGISRALNVPTGHNIFVQGDICEGAFPKTGRVSYKLAYDKKDGPLRIRFGAGQEMGGFRQGSAGEMLTSENRVLQSATHQHHF